MREMRQQQRAEKVAAKAVPLLLLPTTCVHLNSHFEHRNTVAVAHRGAATIDPVLERLSHHKQA